MVLLDSNIVIYSTRPESKFDLLRDFLLETEQSVSLITYVEVLGYHDLNDHDRALFETFFEATPILAISEEIAAHAVRLKQDRKMGLGDSVIAATAQHQWSGVGDQ